MKRWARGLWGATIALVVACAGCGSDGEAAPVGPTTVTPPAECWPERGGTSYVVEPVGAAQEWADCVAGCDHDLPVYEVNTETFAGDGLAGRIDDEAHGFSATAEGPDIDVIAIFAPPRTMVEFLVERASDDDLFEPVIQARDGARGTMTYNEGVVEGFPGARTVVAAPLVGLPFYLVVEHSANYEALRPAGGGLPDSSAFVGGEAYDYIVRVRTSPFAPNDLGELSDSQPLTLEGAELVCGGDTHYYRFTVPGGGTPLVEVTRTGSTDMVPLVAGMNGAGGEQLAWDTIIIDGQDGAADGRVTLDGSDIVAGGGDYIFAVADFNGAADPGDFTYSVNVTLQ